MTKIFYQFQCLHCWIVSGFVSNNPNDAPTCCGGEYMHTSPINQTTENDLQSTSHDVESR